MRSLADAPGFDWEELQYRSFKADASGCDLLGEIRLLGRRPVTNSTMPRRGAGKSMHRECPNQFKRPLHQFPDTLPIVATHISIPTNRTQKIHEATKPATSLLVGLTNSQSDAGNNLRVAVVAGEA